MNSIDDDVDAVEAGPEEVERTEVGEKPVKEYLVGCQPVKMMGLFTKCPKCGVGLTTMDQESYSAVMQGGTASFTCGCGVALLVHRPKILTDTKGRIGRIGRSH